MVCEINGQVFVVIASLMAGLGVISGLRIKKRLPGILGGRNSINISEYYLPLIRDSKACILLVFRERQGRDMERLLN